MGVSADGGPTGQSLWVILNSWRGSRVDILLGWFSKIVGFKGGYSSLMMLD